MDDSNRVSEQRGAGVARASPAGDRRRAGAGPRDAPTGRRAQAIDWPLWLARIERYRRLLHRRHHQRFTRLSDSGLVLATCNSFRVDGIDVDQATVWQALSRSPSQRRMRSRAIQRIRNHVAILHSIDNALRRGQPLKTAAVIRWYTSIAGGLSITEIGSDKIRRLEHIVRRINSPHLRLRPALQEIARTYAELISDPLFPAFNGILARLILRYHLGRCALPPGIDGPSIPLQTPCTPDQVLAHLLAGICHCYEQAQANRDRE
jgi:hypothetical protein